MSHCCFFLTVVRLQAIGERHLVWAVLKRLQHLVSSPSSSISGGLSYGTRRTEKLRFPSESGGFYQFHVSAEVLSAAGSSGGRRGARPLLSSPVRGRGRRLEGKRGPLPRRDDGRMALDVLLNLFFFLRFLLIILGYCPYLFIRKNDLFAGKD